MRKLLLRSLIAGASIALLIGGLNQSGYINQVSANKIYRVPKHIRRYHRKSYKHSKRAKMIKIHKAINKLRIRASINAWTGHRVKRANQALKKSLHLNKYYNKRYNHLCDPSNINDPGIDETNPYFASNVHRHCKHVIVKFSNAIPGLEQSGQYEGTIIYLHNNKATRHTANAFRKYIHDHINYQAAKISSLAIHRNKKRSWLKYAKHWNKHYINNNYKGSDSDQDDFANWRLISPRHQKNSSILFLVPKYGWDQNYMVRD